MLGSAGSSPALGTKFNKEFRMKDTSLYITDNDTQGG